MCIQGCGALMDVRPCWAGSWCTLIPAEGGRAEGARVCFALPGNPSTVVCGAGGRLGTGHALDRLYLGTGISHILRGPERILRGNS